MVLTHRPTSRVAPAALFAFAVLMIAGCDASGPQDAPRFAGAVHRAESDAIALRVTGGRLVATARGRGALAVEMPRAGAAGFVYRADVAPGGMIRTETVGADDRPIAWTAHVRTGEAFALSAGAPGLRPRAATLEAYDGDRLVYRRSLDSAAGSADLSLGVADDEPTSWHTERIRLADGTVITIVATDYRAQNLVGGAGDGSALFTPEGAERPVRATDVRVVFEADEAPVPRAVRFTQTAGGRLELRDEQFGRR